MTKDELFAQGILFFIAGHGTTSLTISYLAHSLAVNPEIQDKLYEEIDRVLGDKVQYNSV